MPAVVQFPHIVDEALATFGNVFANACQRRHFGEYLTGLLIAERKNVTAIRQELVFGTDPSSLNRYLTEASWDMKTLNRSRLDWLQEAPATRYHAHGVIPLDNVLISHPGEMIAAVAWFWDHADDRYKVAHDYIFANYVCPTGAHYPLTFRRFQTAERCAALEVPFRKHTALAMELIDGVCAQGVPGAFVFDSYFTNAEILNHINAKEMGPGRRRAYVGDLKFNRKVHWRGQEWVARDVAAEHGPEVRQSILIDGRGQWYATCEVALPRVGHKVRIFILWNAADALAPCKILVTNQTHWEIHKTLDTYRQRWTGTGNRSRVESRCTLRFLLSTLGTYGLVITCTRGKNLKNETSPVFTSTLFMCFESAIRSVH